MPRNLRPCHVRGFALNVEDLFLGSVLFSWRHNFSQKTSFRTEGSPLSGRKRLLEKLWHDFFTDPSQWCDHRLGKGNPRYPDFKHNKTQQSLWLIDKSNPPWVKAKLAAIARGTLQSNAFPWNTRLRRYVKDGDYNKAINVFRQMQREGVSPDKFTFVPVLNACSHLLALREGRSIHLQITKYAFDSDMYVSTSLFDMYVKCGSIEDARRVFNKLPTRNVISWNAMILGYLRSGDGRQALEVFHLMQSECVDSDPVTFVRVLNACASIGALEDGRRAHKQLNDRGYGSDVYVANSLVDMYAKCGSLEEAQQVFDRMPTRDAVSWSTLILGYVKCGQGQEALNLCQQMQLKGVDLDPLTFVGLLNACASVGAFEEGKRAHEQIIDKGYESNAYVATSLVDMYSKCGRIEDARQVFENIPTRGVVAWSAMILGYVKCGQGQEALELSQRMQQEGVELNTVTFVGVLNACAFLGALEEGRHTHEVIIDRGYESDVYVASALVDMYGKCGSIEDARGVFNKMSTRNVVSWNAMLAGYRLHGYAKEALDYFEQMCQEEVEVDGVTFVSLLSACSHGGLVDEGMHYLESMTAVFCIHPTVEHYACVVDLLSRAGRLHEAEDLIRNMPCEPDEPVWMSLLGACRAHGNMEMGEHGAHQLLNFDPETAKGNLLLSNIYAAAGKWDKVQAVHHWDRIHQEKLKRGVHKLSCCTWIEIDKKLHSFAARENNHPQMMEIGAELARLSIEMKAAGYFSDASEERKEFPLLSPDREIGIAYGVICTAPPTPLRIVKSLPVFDYCPQCH